MRNQNRYLSYKPFNVEILTSLIILLFVLLRTQTFRLETKKVQNGGDTFYRQLEAGNRPKKKKTNKFIDVDKRILNIVSD